METDIEQTPSRGDTITTPGGGVGRYVGTTATGLVWMGYEPGDFPIMCAAFDTDRLLRIEAVS